MDSCLTKRPRFLKIILDDDLRDGKFSIPRKFARIYGKDISNPIILRVLSDAKWEVELVKCDGKIWLQNGLQKFLNHYSLVHGSFLIFEYNQIDSDFNVIIFDKSASEIDYPLMDIEEELQEQSIEEIGSDDSVEILSHFLPNKKIRKKPGLPKPGPNKKMKAEAKRRAKCMSSKKQIRTKPLTFKEKANALSRAASNFESENPYFIVAMQASYVHVTHQLAIPASFANKYFKKQNYNIILSTMDGKIWPVEYSHYMGDGNHEIAKLKNGWKAFAQENHLEIGDVCLFELIDCAITNLKVVIFRNFSQGKCKQLKHEESTSKKQDFPRNSCSIFPGDVKASGKFNSAKPFFKATICPSYLENGTLAIPIGFMTKYIKKSTKKVMLQVGSKQWPVKLIYYPDQSRFSAGWSSFAKENSLRVGDICMFELIDREAAVVNVSFYRIVE